MDEILRCPDDIQAQVKRAFGRDFAVIHNGRCWQLAIERTAEVHVLENGIYIPKKKQRYSVCWEMNDVTGAITPGVIEYIRDNYRFANTPQEADTLNEKLHESKLIAERREREEEMDWLRDGWNEFVWGMRRAFRDLWVHSDKKRTIQQEGEEEVAMHKFLEKGETLTPSDYTV